MGSPNYLFIWTRDGLEALHENLIKADELRSDFICLNDDTIAPDEAARNLTEIDSWMAQHFPDPAPWEII